MRFVFDSGPLISLSKTCLLDIIARLPGEFYISPAVYREVYVHPRTKRMYAWSAERIGELVGKKIAIQTLSAQDLALVDELDRVLNQVFYTSRGPLKILQRGELESVVLARKLDKVLVMDERTLRLIIEDPELLKTRLERKIHGWVKMDKNLLEEGLSLIRDIFVIRSVDLVAYAYEKGLFHDKKDPITFLKAALYALKYSGCSVTDEEIENYVRGL